MSSSDSAASVLVSPSVCVCGVALQMLSVQVHATTGNVYNLRVAMSDSVDYLRRIIAKKTKLSKDRILLLYKDRQLRDGNLEDNSIRDGSKLHLVPSVETGLLSQRPEQSVMQALESLNDGQVTDFLSGKAPLNLTMRLGDHMMLIQLQLSTVSPVPPPSGGSRSAHHHGSQRRPAVIPSSDDPSSAAQYTSQHSSSGSSSSASSYPPTSSRHHAVRHHHHHHRRHHHHHHHHHSHPYHHHSQPNYYPYHPYQQQQQQQQQQSSPQQSQPLNLQQLPRVSSADLQSLTSHHQTSPSSSSSSLSIPSTPPRSTRTPTCSTPNSGMFVTPSSPSSGATYPSPSSSPSQRSNTSTSSIATPSSPSFSQRSNTSTSSIATPSSPSQRSNTSNSSIASSPPWSPSSSWSPSLAELPPRVCPHVSTDSEDALPVGTDTGAARRSVGGRVRGVGGVGLDTRALAEASRNLTQTLRHLSSEVLTSRLAPPASSNSSSSSAPETASNSSASSTAATAAPTNQTKPNMSITPAAVSRSSRTTRYSTSASRGACPSTAKRAGPDLGMGTASSIPATGAEGGSRRSGTCAPTPPQGAIIESMQHHGKGVFSGTFSGTLNPALQDRQGRPKRDISTIIHILNDLLCATPQYTSGAAAAAVAAAASAVSGSHAASSAAAVQPQASPAAASQETVSAEDAATRSRVEQVRAMLQQRAERRRARLLAKTAASITSNPYSLPGSRQRTSSEEAANAASSHSKETARTANQEQQHLMRELLKDYEAVTASSQQDRCHQADFGGSEHTIHQVQNCSTASQLTPSGDQATVVVSSKATTAPPQEEQPEQAAAVEVTSLNNTTQLKQETQQDALKLPQGDQQQNQQEQQQQQQQQQNPKQQQSKDSDQQDAAKLVPLNSGTVVA